MTIQSFDKFFQCRFFTYRVLYMLHYRRGEVYLVLLTCQIPKSVLCEDSVGLYFGWFKVFMYSILPHSLVSTICKIVLCYERVER